MKVSVHHQTSNNHTWGICFFLFMRGNYFNTFSNVVASVEAPQKICLRPRSFKCDLIWKNISLSTGRQLEMRSFWITQMSFKSNEKCLCKSKKTQKRGDDYWRWRQRLESQPWAKQCLWPLDVGRGKGGVSPLLLEGAQACWHLDWRLLPFTTIRE